MHRMLFPRVPDIEMLGVLVVLSIVSHDGSSLLSSQPFGLGIVGQGIN